MTSSSVQRDGPDPSEPLADTLADTLEQMFESNAANAYC